MSKKKTKSSPKKKSVKAAKPAVKQQKKGDKKAKALVPKLAKKLVKSKSSPKPAVKPVKKATKVVKKAVAKVVKKATLPSKAAQTAKKKVVKKTGNSKTAPVKKAAKAPLNKSGIKSKPIVQQKKDSSSKQATAKQTSKKVVEVKKPIKTNELKQKSNGLPVKETKQPIALEIKKLVQDVPSVVQVSASAQKSTKADSIKEVKREPFKLAAVKPVERTSQEPNGKYEIEFVIHSSPSILFEFLTTPSGLSEWFCDDVNIRNGIFTFFWDGAQQQARLIKITEDRAIRFQWLERNDGSYFEFRIQKDDLTNDISLIITDFAETKEEENSSRLLWNSQIEKLMHVLGSYY